MVLPPPPDSRKVRKHLSAFALLSLKDPSLLAFDQRRSDGNRKTLFGIRPIPRDTQMREILDPVDPEHLRDSLGDVFRQLQRGKALEPFVFYAGHYLLSLDESNQDLRVDFLEYNEYDADGKRLKHFTWITDLHVTLRNAWQFARGGRARWRIENETFNTLKNQGYHYEHNVGHGQRNLSVAFAMLRMLAFLVDQAQQLCCPLFCAVWKKLGSKRALWDNLRSHFRHFRFRSMRQLDEAILYDLAKEASLPTLDSS